jgi:hypothetical protein
VASHWSGQRRDSYNNRAEWLGQIHAYENRLGLVELRSGKIQFDGSDRSRFSLPIVEQNAKKSLAVSHRGYVLEMGKKRFEGEGQSLLTNIEVSALYLGG